MSLHASAATTLRSWSAPNPVQERLRSDFVRHLDAHPDGVWRNCVPDHITASSLVLDHSGRRVALVLHGKQNIWLPTGGHCEPEDGSLADTALREATEETGIEGLALLDPSAPQYLDRHDVSCQVGVVDDPQPTRHLDVQYFSIAPAGADVNVSDESHDIGWFAYDDLPSPIGDDVPALVELAVSSFATAITR